MVLEERLEVLGVRHRGRPRDFSRLAMPGLGRRRRRWGTRAASSCCAGVVEQVHEQLVDLVDDLGDAGVGAVDLVDAPGSTGMSAPSGPCAARSGSAAAGPRRRRRAGRRRRPWTARARPHRRKSAWPGVSMMLIDHPVGQARVEGGLPGVVDGGVLRQDRDALLPLQVTGVHRRGRPRCRPRAPRTLRTAAASCRPSVVFPWSTCATMATLRRSERVVFPDMGW